VPPSSVPKSGASEAGDRRDSVSAVTSVEQPVTGKIDTGAELVHTWGMTTDWSTRPGVVDHNVVVTRGGSQYLAWCRSCGWSSDRRPSGWLAARDRAVHLEDVDDAATRAGIPRQLRPRQSAA
jgi:hypothetical protein